MEKVAREANYEHHINEGAYGIEENWVPKDIWWEDSEMQGNTQLDFDAALAAAYRQKILLDTLPRNAEGDYTI